MNQQSEGEVLRLLKFVRRSGQVHRYHSEVVIKAQNVGEHSYGVAWICYMLTNQRPMSALLIHALAHDAAEHITGDIPSPTKRSLGIRTQVAAFESAIMKDVGLELPPLDDHNQHILDLADGLEGVLYCKRELDLGNSLILPVYHNFVSYVREELKSYRDKYGEAYGVGALFAENMALSILAHASHNVAPRTVTNPAVISQEQCQ